MTDTTCPACTTPVDLARPHVTLLRQTETTVAGMTTVTGEVTVIEYRHPRCEPASDRGMTVDGDVLRDAIAEAVPRILTDTAAHDIAAAALDAAVRVGMTVLHGRDQIPRVVPAEGVSS